MAYILLDESGDLGFSAHSSKFFIVTILFADSKRPLERVSRRVHKTLGKKFKKVGVLHAYNEEPVTRQRLLHQASALDCSVLAIVLNKSKVDEKAVLYNYVTNILLDRLFTKKPVPLNGPVHLIASKRETNKFLNHNFTEYLTHQVNTAHKIPIKVEIATPQKEKSLQVVDFVSWALFRKYELADESYYNLIRSKIVEEAPLFP